MPAENKKLYLFEAIELRNAYDIQIDLLKKLLFGEAIKEYFSEKSNDDKFLADDYKPATLEKELQKISHKRLKLNQEIQNTNYSTKINYIGDEITIAEALELRKALKERLKFIKQKIDDSTMKRIIHKEDRDIEIKPTYEFKECFNEYNDALDEQRELLNQIHSMNHSTIINFREE